MMTQGFRKHVLKYLQEKVDHREYLKDDYQSEWERLQRLQTKLDEVNLEIERHCAECGVSEADLGSPDAEKVGDPQSATFSRAPSNGPQEGMSVPQAVSFAASSGEKPRTYQDW